MLHEVLEVQRRIQGAPSSLDLSSNPNRRFIMEGSMLRVSGSSEKKAKKYRVFLFTDLLLYSEMKSRMGPTQYKYVGHKLLHTAMIIDYSSAKGGNNIFEIYHTDDKQRYKFQVPSSYEKTAWKNRIESQIQICSESQSDENGNANESPFPGAAPIEPVPAIPRIGIMRTLSGTGSSSHHARKASSSFSHSPGPSPAPLMSSPSLPMSGSSGLLTIPSQGDLPHSTHARLVLDGRMRSLSTGSDSGEGSGVSTPTPSPSTSQFLTPSSSPSSSPASNSSFLLPNSMPSSPSSVADSGGESGSGIEDTEPAEGRVDPSTLLSPMDALMYVLYSDQTESSLLQAYLLVYKEFTNASDLLAMLVKAYSQATDPALIAQNQQITYSRYHMKRRVLEFLRTWIWHLFFKDLRGKLYSELLVFMEAASADGLRDEVNTLKLLVLKMARYHAENKGRKATLASNYIFSPGGSGFLGSPTNGLPVSVSSINLVQQSMSPAPAPFPTQSPPNTPSPLTASSSFLMSSPSPASPSIIPLSPSSPSLSLPLGLLDLRLADINTQTIAEQMTIMDQAMFRRVSVAELSALAWRKRSGVGVSGVQAMIERFNVVSQWVSTEIVCAKDAKTRISLTEKFITIAQKLAEIRSYNSMMAVLSGLNIVPVTRLKQMWAGVSQSCIASFDRLNELMHPKQNFTNYRQALRRGSPPAVPYFGMYLRDITFLEEGNETTVEGQVNIAKIQMVAKIFREIQIFQGASYPYQIDEAYRAYLKRLHGMPEDILYTFSKRAEAVADHSGSDSPRGSVRL
eukprot:TRINITY_DN2889_c0_g1_i2.p1 TRINITY_DN2889_c0_g1~~TRINITY_DN2889_c0_g1_i2.p1  ORF type:complete len:795 (+),score=162.28 TRINITY_DN2889_c0_g1_i2:187-2571(+)